MPPMSSLRAFAAFVQTGSVVQAGAALNISPAAISQQLRALERHLGLTLLDRSARALSLTADGDKLARAVDQGFSTISDALQELATTEDGRPVHISSTPSFAAAWLMPRLPAFRTAHPEISLMLNPTAEVVTLEPGGVDIALRYGMGNWPGVDSRLLLSSPIVVAAAPSLLAGKHINSPTDLAALPWLEELGTTEATRWLKVRGVAGGLVGGFVQMPGNMLIDAARDGQGVIATVRKFISADLDAGRLVELFSEPQNAGYYIVTRPGILRPAARAFAKWLRLQRDDTV